MQSRIVGSPLKQLHGSFEYQDTEGQPEHDRVNDDS
jgi:hypothetical protein